MHSFIACVLVILLAGVAIVDIAQVDALKVFAYLNGQYSNPLLFTQVDTTTGAMDVLAKMPSENPQWKTPDEGVRCSIGGGKFSVLVQRASNPGWAVISTRIGEAPTVTPVRTGFSAGLVSITAAGSFLLDSKANILYRYNPDGSVIYMANFWTRDGMFGYDAAIDGNSTSVWFTRYLDGKKGLHLVQYNWLTGLTRNITTYWAVMSINYEDGAMYGLTQLGESFFNSLNNLFSPMRVLYLRFMEQVRARLRFRR